MRCVDCNQGSDADRPPLPGFSGTDVKLEVNLHVSCQAKCLTKWMDMRSPCCENGSACVCFACKSVALGVLMRRCEPGGSEGPSPTEKLRNLARRSLQK